MGASPRGVIFSCKETFCARSKEEHYFVTPSRVPCPFCMRLFHSAFHRGQTTGSEALHGNDQNNGPRNMHAPSVQSETTLIDLVLCFLFFLSLVTLPFTGSGRISPLLS